VFIGSLSNGPAKKAGMSFMENINNAVIVYILSAFIDFFSARRAGGDFFRYRLITVRAKSHDVTLKVVWFQNDNCVGPLMRGRGSY
jgi:hypothetical protein